MGHCGEVVALEDVQRLADGVEPPLDGGPIE